MIYILLILSISFVLRQGAYKGTRDWSAKPTLALCLLKQGTSLSRVNHVLPKVTAIIDRKEKLWLLNSLANRGFSLHNLQ